MLESSEGRYHHITQNPEGGMILNPEGGMIIIIMIISPSNYHGSKDKWDILILLYIPPWDHAVKGCIILIIIRMPLNKF